jgi:phosphate ABC transporter permease protein PstC
VPAGDHTAPRGRTGASSDRRAELTLGALSVALLVLIGLMLVTVAINAWPSFSANGLSWFGSGGNVTTQFLAMHSGKALPGHSLLYFRAWPLIWGTLITTVGAVVLALVISIFAAVFMVEFAPARVQRVLEPTVRLLAGVPSVVYGLVGILAIAPFIEGLITNSRKRSVFYVVQLSGLNLTTATLILTLMIVPIMVAITANALSAVPVSWREGSAALGVNRWRTIRRVSLRTARPAIAAATVLATARALGEAIMLAMVAGGPFAPNPLDGLTFLVEPVQPLGATIVHEFGGVSNKSVLNTIYAISAVLLVSAMFLSLAGWAAKQSMRRYGIRA